MNGSGGSSSTGCERQVRASLVLHAAVRQDATELAILVRKVGPEGIAECLAGLDSGRKEAMLLALACAADVDRTPGQWWGWLDGQQPVARPGRSVPRAAEVLRFARDHDLSTDQVWRAIVNLHTTCGPGLAGSSPARSAWSR
jgi:hypothetical protein